MDLNTVSTIAFLALTIWREARGESRAAKLAVAHSILNRVARPSWWGQDVLGVVFKRWQYSSLTAPGDPNLVAWPGGRDAAWQECLAIARDVLGGAAGAPAFPGADSYHDTSIAPPAWTAKARYCGQSGRIRFYDVDHDFEAAVTGHPLAA